VIQAGGETLHSDSHKLINSTWNKEELPQQCKETITVLIYKKGDKTNNYTGISLLLTNKQTNKQTNTLLHGILLEKLVVVQLVKTLPAIYRTLRFITVFRKAHQ